MIKPSPCSPPAQPGIFTQLMTAAEERPWLWVIYLLTVGLPVGLLLLFCWPKVPKNEPGHAGTTATSGFVLWMSSRKQRMTTRIRKWTFLKQKRRKRKRRR